MKKSERVEVGPECGRCGTNNREARSFCRKCGCFLKPTRVASAPAKRKQRARPKLMSARRQSQQERRAEVVREVHLRDRGCQAGAVHALTGIPCEGPLDCHELVNRSQWALGFLDPSNVILACRRSHEFVTTHPVAAHAMSLHLYAWERHRLIGGGKVAPPDDDERLNQ